MKLLNAYINEALIKGHYKNQYDDDFVNLGLPSGTLWCNHNIGANNPEEYGDYFMWGDTKALKGKFPNWDMWNDLKLFNYLKGDILKLSDDAAYVNSHGKCVMPTMEDAKELIKNTVQKRTCINDILCVEFISIHDNTQHIIIPCAGYYGEDSSNGINNYGAIWTSTLDHDKISCILSVSDELGDINRDFKYTGRSVRGVIKR